MLSRVEMIDFLFGLHMKFRSVMNCAKDSLPGLIL